MRLIFLFILLSSVCYSQRLNRGLYEVKMEALSISKLQLSLDTLIQDEKHWSPFQRLRLTLKTRLNSNIISKIDIDDGNLFDELDSDDYWSIGAYDFRGKYYLNKICRITGRILVTGIETKTYLYSMGIVIKF